MSLRPTSGLGLLQLRGTDLVLTLPGRPAGTAATEVSTWAAAVEAAGGTVTDHTRAIAADLIAALAAAGVLGKIVYFLAFLGSNIGSALVPLIDRRGVGAPLNYGFGSSDFSEATGLSGGTGKRLTLSLAPAQLGAANNGGIGWWETNAAAGFASAEWPIGIVNNYPTDGRFLLVLSATTAALRWGANANQAVESAAQSNGHYYGQRASATDRRLYRAGAQIASNTTSDPANGAANPPFGLMSLQRLDGAPVAYWGGRCAATYFTDGTLTDTEAAALHDALQTKLMTPLGRA